MPAHDTGAARRLTRWIPAIAAPVAIGVAVVVVPMQANAAVDLPDLTPEELLELAASSDVDALSGTMEQTSELGLPDLSGLTGAMGGRGSDDGTAASATDLDDVVSLVTGTHTARVYLDESNARLQVLDPLAERDVYVSQQGVWVYDSRAQAATHVTPPPAADVEALKAELEAWGEAARAQVEAQYGAPLPNPGEVLDRALAKLDESTDVSVGTDALVAGREAYELVLEPRDPDTLVGSVRVAIDGDTGVALAASVTARNVEEPAFSVAFTDISFEAPDASVFEFTPPAGTEVTEHQVPLPSVAELEQWKAEAEAGAVAPEGMPRPVVHGEGWSAVVELPAGEGGAKGLGGEASAMLDGLTTRVDGGRVVQTSLITVLFTDDGRVLAGAVTADHLLDVAANGR
ncbi:hypothetical protein [Agromyces sp. Marseille-P2726]|uniref:LolA family protein n=1 Tax=Agromyces sp. Marseille-P2726 TaxID=2709132 RepID=UPI0015704A61|nr:hypothetical protein [Agromyces sp. Marseille-P2726]